MGRAQAPASVPGRPREARLRFTREARLAASLSHPGLVRVFDGGVIERQPDIAMELISGESLDALMRRAGVFRWRDALSIGQQLAESLAYLHQQQVLHRDIKPSNVMVPAPAAVKLTDLGLARRVDGTCITAGGLVVGTMTHLAPELLVGSDEATCRSDLWSLGCVLYLNPEAWLKWHPQLTGRPSALGSSRSSAAGQRPRR